MAGPTRSAGWPSWTAPACSTATVTSGSRRSAGTSSQGWPRCRGSGSCWTDPGGAGLAPVGRRFLLRPRRPHPRPPGGRSRRPGPATAGLPGTGPEAAGSSPAAVGAVAAARPAPAKRGRVLETAPCGRRRPRGRGRLRGPPGPDRRPPRPPHPGRRPRSRLPASCWPTTCAGAGRNSLAGAATDPPALLAVGPLIPRAFPTLSTCGAVASICSRFLRLVNAGCRLDDNEPLAVLRVLDLRPSVRSNAAWSGWPTVLISTHRSPLPAPAGRHYY